MLRNRSATVDATRTPPSTEAAPSIRYRFAQFELQPRERRLFVSGAPVDVVPRAFDLLTALVERGGHLLTKDELLDRVWPRVVVEENNLHVQVCALRKVLGTEAIETIPGWGYRFTLEVTRAGDWPPTSYATRRHNLPQHSTSFIGREIEIAEIRTLLGRTRLVTLTGSGGCGKTRLALEVAAGLLDSYPDGVWLVELASVVDPSLVPQAVGTVLGLKEEQGKTLTETVTEHLVPRQLLLVLDNAEHLLAACAELTESVQRHCPRVIMVATSRERLGISGEQTYRVPGMSLPDPERDATTANLLQCDSVRLFTERARLNLPHFAITNENAPALASICRRLDGIPLAIELAAARARSMSVEAVSQRLDQRFRLLTGGSRAAPRRQQTLRALIDWSYDLLSDAEKALLCRASIFSGGWTLEAAEQVCVGEGIDDWEVLDIVTSLADKSLLLAEARDGATRYRLLETVRQYARERLQETGEESRWQGRHFGYFLDLAERAEPRLKCGEQAWLDQMEAEHDNLRTAMGWATASARDAAGGLRLAGALWWFWDVRAYLSEGRGWLSKLLAAAPHGQAAAARAKALHGAGALAWQQCDLPAARELQEEALAIWRALGDRRGIADASIFLGLVDSDEGDRASARALYGESLAIRRALGDQWGVSFSLNNLGNVAFEEGDYPAARALYEESLAIRREVGDRLGIGLSLNKLGNVAYEQGDYPAARTLHEESLAIRRALGDRLGVGISLANLGDVAFAQCDYSSASALHAESLAVNREVGARSGVAQALEGLASVVSVAGQPERAARVWGKAEGLREELGCPLPPHERSRHERRIVAARARLGDDAAFDLAWNEGRAMTLDQTVAHAMEKHDG